MDLNYSTNIFSTPSFSNTTEVTMPAYVLPFNSQWVIASTIILVIFFVFGVAANSITIAVIYRTPCLRNHYNYFLASICISDIISALVSILFLYRRIWGFLYFAWPEILCRFYWAFDFWTSFATAWLILSYAILRLIGVKWPHKFKKISAKDIKIWLASVWSLTFLGGFIPHFIFNTVNVIDRNNDLERARWASCSLSSYWFITWQIYIQFAYAFFIFLPALAIIFISLLISLLLWKTRFAPGSHANVTIKFDLKTNIVRTRRVFEPKNKSETLVSSSKSRWKKRKRIVYQLTLIVSSFLFGYIPLTVFHYYTGFIVDTSNAEMNALDWRFAMIQYMMLRFSECLNPVFYNAASFKIRRETFNMLRKISVKKIKDI